MVQLLRLAALCAALAWPLQALAAWREVTTDHFVVYSDEPAEAVRAYAAQLERYDGVLRRLHGLAGETLPLSGKLIVFVLPTASAVSSMYGEGGGSVGGFYVPHVRGAVAYVPRPSRRSSEDDLSGQVVLRHEYAHHFMLSNFSAAYPPWYVEGFAEFGATTKFEDDGGVVIGLPPQFRAYELLVHPRELSVEEMVQTDRRMTRDESDRLHARGWLLTHYLNFSTERRGQLAAYLRAINEGSPSPAAAQAAFGDLRQLDREIVAYAKGKMPAGRLTGLEVPAGEIRQRELSAGENATMPVRMRSKRGVTREEALKLVPDARRLAGPYPGDAAAQLALAEAEFDAGAMKEAEAAADRALAADPKSAQAMIYKGLVRRQQAMASGDANSPLWREARLLFVQANRLDLTHPEPLIHFYSPFPGAPTRNAVDGLMAAYSGAPHDRILRLVVARQHLLDGKPAEARRALLPVVLATHSGSARELAVAVIEGIEQGKSGADLAANLPAGLGAASEDGGGGRPTAPPSAPAPAARPGRR